jgi:hypothetical protein
MGDGESNPSMHRVNVIGFDGRLSGCK